MSKPDIKRRAARHAALAIVCARMKAIEADICRLSGCATIVDFLASTEPEDYDPRLAALVDSWHGTTVDEARLFYSRS